MPPPSLERQHGCTAREDIHNLFNEVQNASAAEKSLRSRLAAVESRAVAALAQAALAQAALAQAETKAKEAEAQAALAQAALAQAETKAKEAEAQAKAPYEFRRHSTDGGVSRLDDRPDPIGSLPHPAAPPKLNGPPMRQGTMVNK